MALPAHELHREAQPVQRSERSVVADGDVLGVDPAEHLLDGAPAEVAKPVLGSEDAVAHPIDEVAIAMEQEGERSLHAIEAVGLLEGCDVGLVPSGEEAPPVVERVGSRQSLDQFVVRGLLDGALGAQDAVEGGVALGYDDFLEPRPPGVELLNHQTADVGITLVWGPMGRVQVRLADGVLLPDPAQEVVDFDA